MPAKQNVLVVYFNLAHPLRSTTSSHLNSFKGYSSHRCFYLNLAVWRAPGYLKSVRFDLIIFHTSLLSQRADLRSAEGALSKSLQTFREMDGLKVTLPQDECVHTKVLCEFINEMGIGYVFSVAPESEWPVIYDTVDPQKVRFVRVLTGYLDPEWVSRVDKLAASAGTRSVDICYRARRHDYFLGRHGRLKTTIADAFGDQAPKKGLTTDISTREEDTLYGDDWLKFLLGSKYIIGVEGGASLLDRDGEIKERTQRYMEAHPEAGFEEVEAACYPNEDGNLGLVALSPRHLEACATRTGQVLVEGEYNGVLAAGKHYIELKRDFSNIDQVLEAVASDDLRADMTERAYRDVVESERYTYRALVEQVVDIPLATHPSREESLRSALWSALLYRWMLVADKLSWIVVASLNRTRTLLRAVLPSNGYEKLSLWARNSIHNQGPVQGS